MQTPRRAAVPESKYDKQCKGTIMINDKTRNNKNRTKKPSMEPEIHERSAVFTKTQSEYNVGDIVQYFDGEYNPVRRITEISDDGKTYTVQGDNEAADKAVKIDAKNVSGRVLFSHKALY